MKNIYKKMSVLFAIGLILIISCSKEDSEDVSENQNRVEVSRYQIITVALPDVKLSENEYQGTLGGIPVTLTKSEDNKLLFFLPSSAAIGTLDLVIPSLNNVTFHYNVKETVLKNLPEETLVPLFTNLDSYAQKRGTSSGDALTMQNNLTEFKKYYNNASFEEKKQVAMFYQSNKSMIDEIILNDYSNVTTKIAKTKITLDHLKVLFKFSLSVVATGGGGVMAYVGPDLGTRLLGLAVAGVGVVKCKDFFEELMKVEPFEEGVSIGSYLGINNKINSSTALTFQDNTSSVLSINSLRRKFKISDSNSKKELVISFFKDKDIYNNTVNKINSAIQYVNNNNSFLKLQTFQLATLPSTTSSVQTVMTKETFDKFRFTITDSNLTLVSAALESDGQLNVKIKITGTPASLPVESFLNYSYSDEFSSFSGKIPVKVVVPKCTPDMLAGNWEFKLYNYDSSNPNGYVYAGSYSITINTTPSYCGSSDPSTIVGGLMISNDVANATPTCWYLNNCSVINFTNIGYFDFVPGVSVYTVYANSTHKVDGSRSHVTMTKL